MPGREQQPSILWGSPLRHNASGFTESQVSGHHVCGQLTDVGKLLCRCKAQFCLRVSVACLEHKDVKIIS